MLVLLGLMCGLCINLCLVFVDGVFSFMKMLSIISLFLIDCPKQSGAYAGAYAPGLIDVNPCLVTQGLSF